MTRILAVLVLATLATGAAAQTRSQQGVPTINIDPSCRAAASGSIGLTQDYEACRQSEFSARDTLAKQWNEFLASDRASCYRLTTIGTPGTYTELLTCLEMKRDARRLPNDSGTIGLGTQPQRKRGN